MKTKINKNVKKNNKRLTNKKKYKIRNWREYNDALVRRGMLDVYLAESAINNWYAEPVNRPGAKTIYADSTIKLVLQFGAVFGQKLRQTEGLVKSIFRLINIDLLIPDFTTLSRRAGRIDIKLPKSRKEKLVLVADSTGLKVYGEGEWKVRMHGYSKHRTWRKIHLIISPDGEIRQAELTANNVADSEMLPKILKAEDARIEKFIGDGGYDKLAVYQACRKQRVRKIVIPPQHNAKIRQHGNCLASPHPRDENIRMIRKSSRKKWKEKTGYHLRSLAETAMFRLKTIFGDKLNARNFQNQKTEIMIKLSLLNQMRGLGMPDSYAVA